MPEIYADIRDDRLTGKQAFGWKFKRLRETKGLTQRYLAGRLDVSEAAISRMEAGTRRPPANANFYRRLYEVPEFSDSDVKALLDTGILPPWLDDGQRRNLGAALIIFKELVVADWNIELQIRAPEHATRQQAETMMAFLALELETTAEDVVQHWKQRMEQRKRRFQQEAQRAVLDEALDTVVLAEGNEDSKFDCCTDQTAILDASQSLEDEARERASSQQNPSDHHW